MTAAHPFRPLVELSDSGLLWLINRVVFHPRGLALALDIAESGEATGWLLLGDGSNVWAFTETDDDEGFAKSNATLEGATT